MITISARTASTIAVFRKMHESGCFVIPNPWDTGTAKCLKKLGFKALATTSAGLAFSKGLPDSVTSLGIDDVLPHIKDMVDATDLPVSADFQHGYAREPEALAANVTRCVQTGVAGLSIEDASGDDTGLYERTLAIERIRAARQAIDATGSNAVLTARCEAWLVGSDRPFEAVIDRLVAYAEAGADCLFAPGTRSLEEIGAIVKAVAPKPVNVIMASPHSELSVQRLSELGVRRISVGSAFARVALGAFLRSAASVACSGTFDTLGDAATFGELNEIFTD